MAKQYIFAYGSLINKQSRNKNMKNVEVIYGEVKGYRRSWCISVTDRKFTALGLVEDSSAICNGIYIPVSDEDIISFDKRELDGSGFQYERVRIDSKSCDKAFSDDIVYTYLTLKEKEATKSEPLIQSYIDVVLAGCLDYEKGFAEDFCNQTFGWSQYWINDREEPLYLHPKNIESQYLEIDKLLEDKKG